MSVGQRRGVVWIGPLPASPIEFESRGLAIEAATLESFDDAMKGTALIRRAKAVVFKFTPDLRGEKLRRALRHARNLKEQGLIVLALTTDAEATALFEERRQAGVGAGEFVRIRTDITLHEIAEQIARYNAGPPPGEVACDIGVTDDTKRLLRRAFGDCAKITIDRLDPNRDVFVVHGVLERDQAGTRLQPFFAKVDTVEKIETEINNYALYPARFIPFHLRPNLTPERCCSGCDRGIVVGNFVDHAEPFISAAKRGVGATVVHALFEETLRGWRIQAYDGRGTSKSLIEGIGEQVRPDWFEQSRLRVAKELGAKGNASKLVDALREAGQIEHLTAVMHGDLHVGNVMVRGRDAIVIDFYQTRTGPLVADPAALEASVICSLDKEELAADFGAWRDLVANKLCRPEHFESPPPPAFEPGPREWLWQTVRQLRTVGLSAEVPGTKFAYKAALAYYLLVQARAKGNLFENRRRAAAITIAEKLVSEMVGGL